MAWRCNRDRGEGGTVKKKLASAGGGGCSGCDGAGSGREVDFVEFGLAGHGGIFHAGEGGGDFAEEGLDVEAGLGAGLNEHDVVFLAFGLALLDGDLAGVGLVGFVSDEDDDDVGAALVPHVVDPLVDAEEAGAVGDVVDDDGHARVPDVGRN